MTDNYIKENIDDILKKIQVAAIKSGRDSKDIKLIAVTKTVSAEKITSAIQSGIIDLGENRVQELCEKYDVITDKCNWHLIGHLQTNKVKYIIDKVAMIHSLDSIELANEIQKRAEKINRIIDVLVEVNIAEEESKFGIKKQDTLEFIKAISNYGNLRIKGLMTIAPLAEKAEDIRFVFTELKKLSIDICEKNIHNVNMEYLSMGMSNDYEVAIEEGSNIVRIGTAIFGKR